MADPRRPIYSILLAHHPRAHAHRCLWVPFGPYKIALCSRCLGLYPTLAAILALQIFFRVSQTAGVVDWVVVLLLSVPALFDWGAGHLGWRGKNGLRFATGALLGVALGRSAYLYLVDSLNELFWVQLALLAGGALAFEIVRRFDLSDY